MKNFFVLISLASSFAVAQGFSQESSEIRAPVSELASPKAASPYLEGSADFSASTFLTSGTLANGNRTNYQEMNPKLSAHMPYNVDSHLNVPLFFSAAQTGNNSRYIGRPEVGISKSVVNADETVALNYGLNVRTPLVDTSYGNADYYRVWGFFPNYNVRFPLSAAFSPVHGVQYGSVEYNTDSSLASNGLNYLQTNPFVVLLGAGAGVDVGDRSTVDLTVNFANAIGSPSSNIPGTVSPAVATSNTGAPADLSYLKLGGTFAVATNTKLSGYVVKSLKDSYDHGSGGLQFDDLQSYATLGAGVGISQTF